MDAPTARAPLDPGAEEQPREYYLHERYRGASNRSAALELYYALKPLLPARLLLALRRRYAARQARVAFPAWPIEPVLVERDERELRARLLDSHNGALPVLANWPDGHRYAVVLTHDVEGPSGIANIERVLEVERRHGFLSSWNFVAEWYDIPVGTFERIEHAGGEIGLHGIKHDGKLFASRARFDADLPKIAAYGEWWGTAGFRSPATGRNAAWMHELPCLYDSSFPDSDPFEPQPGGCCSILPFHFGDVVELPITLPQDHTLFEILRDLSIERWVEKSEWLIASHGLINLITHPDYLVADERLALYDSFLAWLRSRQNGWHALPRDVAKWWNERASLTPETAARDPRARVLTARLRGDLAVVEQ